MRYNYLRLEEHGVVIWHDLRNLTDSEYAAIYDMFQTCAVFSDIRWQEPVNPYTRG